MLHHHLLRLLLLCFVIAYECKILPMVDPNIKIQCGVPKIKPDFRAYVDRSDTENPRVIGGEVARAHSWPWQAYLRIKTPAGQTSCGATLINSRWLITAAHCVKSEEFQVKVYLGLHDRSKLTKPYATTKIIRHSEYDENLRQNDIAMIKLKEHVLFNDTIIPACLSDVNLVKPGSELVLTGWGLTSKKPDGTTTRPNFLNQVKLPARTAKNCSFYRVPITDKQICAGQVDGKLKLSCRGDSGGPIVLLSEGRYFLVGAPSFGATNCDNFSVFTRIFAQNKWILDVIENN